MDVRWTENQIHIELEKDGRGDICGERQTKKGRNKESMKEKRKANVGRTNVVVHILLYGY
jgi:hypothetical protein